MCHAVRPGSANCRMRVAHRAVHLPDGRPHMHRSSYLVQPGYVRTPWEVHGCRGQRVSLGPPAACCTCHGRPQSRAEALPEWTHDMLPEPVLPPVKATRPLDQPASHHYCHEGRTTAASVTDNLHTPPRALAKILALDVACDVARPLLC